MSINWYSRCCGVFCRYLDVFCRCLYVFSRCLSVFCDKSIIKRFAQQIKRCHFACEVWFCKSTYIMPILAGAITATFASPFGYWFFLPIGLRFFGLRFFGLRFCDSRYILKPIDNLSGADKTIDIALNEDSTSYNKTVDFHALTCDINESKKNNDELSVEIETTAREYGYFGYGYFEHEYFSTAREHESAAQKEIKNIADVDHSTVLKATYMRCNASSSWLSSWFFGFGYWFVLLYWTYIPLSIAGLDKYYPLLPGVLILPIFLGLQFSVPVWISSAFARLAPNRYLYILKYACFLFIFAIMEYARTIIFPFYPISFVFLSSTITSQLFYFFTPFFLTIIVMAICIYRGLAYFYVLCMCMISALFVGLLPFDDLLATDVKIALIQPNIAQAEKNRVTGGKQAEYILGGLSQEAKADIVVWPEASLPLNLDLSLLQYMHVLQKAYLTHANDQDFDNTETMLTDFLGVKRLMYNHRLVLSLDYDFFLKNFHGLLISGLITLDMPTQNAYTSVVIADCASEDKHIQNIYDKQILIPFGEYVPFRSYLPKYKWLQGLAAQHGDFSKGTTSMVSDLSVKDKKYKAAYMICYESIYSFILPVVDVIFHISNDAWFGNSNCLYMHLDHMKVHAIRNRAVAYRCVNTGITAVIDPFGRILAELPVDHMGMLIAPLILVGDKKYA